MGRQAVLVDDTTRGRARQESVRNRQGFLRLRLAQLLVSVMLDDIVWPIMIDPERVSVLPFTQ